MKICIETKSPKENTNNAYFFKFDGRKLDQAITIYSINADGQGRIDTVTTENVAKTIKILQRQGQLQIRVIKQ